MRGSTAKSASRRVAALVAAFVVVSLLAAGTAVPSWAGESIPTATQASVRPVGSLVGVAYGPEPFQLLDLQVPDADLFSGRRPVLVYLHAGGWIAGDRSVVPDFVSAQVARGYALVSIDYRLATAEPDGAVVASFPGAVWDVKRAIRFVKSNATTWSIDPRRVILVGASAGGYLASFAGTTRGQFEPPDLAATSNRRKDSSVRAVVDFVGPTDLVTFQRTDHSWAAPLTAAFLGMRAALAGTGPTCPDDRLQNASVQTWVDRSDPPIFLAYGALDDLVVPGAQGEPLARVWLATHGGDPASVTYQVVNDAGHNLAAADIVQPFAEFVDQTGSARGQL